MRSTGNDIVALGSIDRIRTNQPRFFSKILSVSEQTLYRTQPLAEISFAEYIWLLWSVKESAYKYLKRILPELLFSPVKINVEQINRLQHTAVDTNWNCEETVTGHYHGKIIFGSYILFFQSRINHNWIATVVNDDPDFKNVHWGIRSIDQTAYDQQSKEARSFLANSLRSFVPGNIEIQKSCVGYPFIAKDSAEMNIPVSLSHDDRFVAYSFVLNTDNN